jgi:hypothetical protein
MPCPGRGTCQRLTETAEQIGSRFYIAPENERGFNPEVDQRPADLHAFGKLAWVLLSGLPQLPSARAMALWPRSGTFALDRVDS